MADRKSFIVFCDRIKELEMLSNEECGLLFKALIYYVSTGEELETGSLPLKLLFSVFKSQIDENSEKYQKKKEANAEYYRNRKNIKNNSENSDFSANSENSVSDTDTETVTDTVTVTKTDTDTVIIKTDNTSLKKEKGTAIDKAINAYTENEELRQAIREFIKFRKAIKAPMTDRAVSLMTGTLDKLGKTNAEKIAIINQSIENGWKGLYELKKPIKETDPDIEQYKSIINKFLY